MPDAASPSIRVHPRPSVVSKSVSPAQRSGARPVSERGPADSLKAKTRRADTAGSLPLAACAGVESGEQTRSVRRTVSILCLSFAWFCANGVAWNLVQVVGWAKMFSDYARVMPVGEALERTLSGEAPCDFCSIAATGEQAQQRLPGDAIIGAGEKFLLAHEVAAPLVFGAPDPAWPGIADTTGMTRIDSVPVPPPRA